MSALTILRYPNQQLRKQAALVETFDDSLKQTIKQLFETLYAVNGWGLAASQISIPLRIFVLDISPDQNQPTCFINPEIITREGEVESEEDSLSFPGVSIVLKRAKKIEVRFQDEDGQYQEQTFEGLLACCIAHQIDYLDGKLFIDHLSNLKRTRLLEKYKKMKPSHAHHHANDHVHGPGCDHHH